MALVMLPCDLPWWDSVKKHLNRIAIAKNTPELIEGMQKIHDLCNVSLDPDEESPDPNTFIGFLNFLDNELTSEERSNFLNSTLPNIVECALRLKELKPKDGLHFSLQQQSDCTELQYSFVASLVANAFFSTFPRRTTKSHPTLQNFNFTHFFQHLHKTVQKTKLKSILHYFDWLDGDKSTGCLKISRQVMSSKEWLTIDDWLECNLPLCPLQIKHEGKLERCDESDWLHICFASAKIGGSVLCDGNTQECINLVTYPELLSVLLNVEALEDNEVLTVERIRQVARIVDPKNRAFLEKLEAPQEMTICCIDADDYKKLPIGQHEEDNILRELNKCLLAFQQKQTKNEPPLPPNQPSRTRRLSPIGESIGSTQSDPPIIPLITQQSCSTNRSLSPVTCDNNNLYDNNIRLRLEADRKLQRKGLINNETLINNRRGRFIVLGSSGECLPVTRRRLDSVYSSCDSSDEEFHSAKTSLDDGSEDENFHKRYSIDLETPERRHTFAQRLRDALNREYSDSFSSSESSYAVGIAVAGAGVEDHDIRVKRGGSTGFALQEDSLDGDFVPMQEQWIDKFKSKQSVLSRKSSDYSFSTEYSSELEEVYEQFSRWLQNPIIEADGARKELQGRELAVVQFAGSLLKRTLSESFAGVPVPLAELGESPSREDFNSDKKNRLVLSAKSLSLELARHKHKLAAQLINTSKEVEGGKFGSKKRRAWFISCVNEAIIQTLEDVTVRVTLPQSQLSRIAKKAPGGPKPVSTGNWGCGSSKCGDVQLKVIIQWLAASVAGVPWLRYYTCGHQQLTKLDTVCRILIDRKWSVKDLAQATLRYSHRVLHGRKVNGTLFEELIGFERTT